MRFKLIRKCAIWGSASLLGACSFAPPYNHPRLPVPPKYPQISQQGVPIAQLGWREFFLDPPLQAVIEIALDNNRDVRIAIGRIEEARAQYRIQASQLSPTINGVASFTRSRTPADLSPSGEAATGNQFQSTLSASWEIDLWGRLRNMRASALENFLATQEAKRSVATSLISQVVLNWLSGHEYDERILLAKRTIAARSESLRIARRRYEVGSASKLDMMTAEAQLKQAETTRV